MRGPGAAAAALGSRPEGDTVHTTSALAVALSLALSPIDSDPPDRKEGDIPAKRIEVEPGVELHVRDFGEGPPVLLLTGGPGFAGSTFEDTARHLAKKHRVILPDQRGTGRSGPTPFEATSLTIESAVRDLEELRKKLELDSWILVGHSWGGILSMSYAAEHTERVAGMVLVDSGGVTPEFFQRYGEAIFARLGEEAQREYSLLRPKEITPSGMAELSRDRNLIMAPGMVARPEAVPLLRAFLGEEQFNPRVGMAMNRALSTFDLRGSLKGFEAPCAVIQGAEDPLGKQTLDEVVAELPEGTPQHLIEDCGHWPYIEAPEEFHRLLDTVLADVTGRG